MAKSLLDLTYDIIVDNQEPISFKELWAKISEINNYTEADKVGRIGKFYTSLLSDGRYINLGDNVWDLREKYEFEKYNDEKKEFYSDVDEDDVIDEGEERDQEEAQYEKEEGKNIYDDEDEDSEEDEEEKPESEYYEE